MINAPCMPGSVRLWNNSDVCWPILIGTYSYLQSTHNLLSSRLLLSPFVVTTATVSLDAGCQAANVKWKIFGSTPVLGGKLLLIPCCVWHTWGSAARNTIGPSHSLGLMHELVLTPFDKEGALAAESSLNMKEFTARCNWLEGTPPHPPTPSYFATELSAEDIPSRKGLKTKGCVLNTTVSCTIPCGNSFKYMTGLSQINCTTSMLKKLILCDAPSGLPASQFLSPRSRINSQILNSTFRVCLFIVLG